jgi:hypothetical protein
MRKLIAFAISSFLTSATTIAYSAPTTPTIAPAAAPPTSTYGAPTINDFLIACKSDHGACVDEIGNAVMGKMTFDGSSNVCFTSPSYGEPVIGWLNSHPETSKMATEDGIFKALQAIYPCDKDNPA